MMGLPPQEEERPERDVSLVTDVFPVLGWSVRSAESPKYLANNNGAQRHPDSDMCNPVATLSVDHMVQVASLYTRFHDSFVHTKGTDDSAFFERALGRYYAFMMLKKKHPGVLLVPTHDIEFAWQAHLVRYAGGCCAMHHLWHNNDAVRTCIARILSGTWVCAGILIM